MRAPRWLATILLGVLLFGAVLPGLVPGLAAAHGLRAERGSVPLPVEVCSGQGSRWVADPPAHAAHSEDCPYCRWDSDPAAALGGPADGPRFLASTGPWPRDSRAGIVVAAKPDGAHRARAPPGVDDSLAPPFVGSPS